MAWYSNGKMLSHNKIFNFVLGNRGGGKSFNAKEWAIKDFKKKGKQFVWVRRYKTEMKKLSTFFADIQFMFPDDKLEVKGNTAYVNDKVAGYFIPLSTSQRDKSVPFPLVNKIIFDEFLIDKGSLRYLPNEVEVFLELFETVARLRDDVRAVFLANSISIVNPYFTYWRLKPKPDKRFNVFDDIVVEFYADDEYINEKLETRFGKLVSKTSYGAYSIHNQFLRDDDNFIEDKTPHSRFEFAYAYEGITYGIWRDYKSGRIYINQKYDTSSRFIYSIAVDEHKVNHLLIDTLKNSNGFKTLKKAFGYGVVYFDSQETKKNFIECYKHF